MKKYITLALVALLAAVGCDNNTTDAVQTRTLTFETLSNAIDNSQYFGSLLYSGGGYEWHDTTTDICSSLPNYWGDGTFFGGGIAISNYVDSTSTPTYEQQLTIAESPHSGSNFAVCYVATNLCPPYIEFKGDENTIHSLYIMPTAYTDSVVQHGNDFSPAMPGNGYIRIEATGIDSAGKTTATAEFYLYDGTQFHTWREWSLAALGSVKRVEFRMFEGTTESGKRIDSTAEYPTYPSYFAIDDIAVQVAE